MYVTYLLNTSRLSPGRFWHITDLHLDPTYHLAPDPTKVCFSSKGVPAAHAGIYGDFLCDSPYSLIQSAFAHMAPLTQPQDFIIWTGSVPMWKQERLILWPLRVSFLFLEGNLMTHKCPNVMRNPNLQVPVCSGSTNTTFRS